MIFIDLLLDGITLRKEIRDEAHVNYNTIDGCDYMFDCSVVFFRH